jgi:hypothetical protein
MEEGGRGRGCVRFLIGWTMGRRFLVSSTHALRFGSRCHLAFGLTCFVFHRHLPFGLFVVFVIVVIFSIAGRCMGCVWSRSAGIRS